MVTGHRNYLGDLAGYFRRPVPPKAAHNRLGGTLEKKLFWIIFLGLSTLADVFLPLFWGMVATLPVVVLSWWLVYRSDWLC